MSGRQIGVIYFYIVSTASLALIVIGVFAGINYLVNITQYEKYPLPYYQENCESYPSKRAMTPVLEGVSATPSASELEKEKLECLKSVEFERKQKQVNDLKDALTFTLIGSVLFLIHFPLARKNSK